MQKNPNEIVIFLTVSTFLILVMVGFILTILFLYRQKQIIYLQELGKVRSDYEKALLRTQLEMQEQTFQTLSRDIHDNINLSLTLAKLNLNTLNLSDRAQSIEKINASVDFVSKAIIDLTDISRSMNSDIITERGLISALEQEIDKLRRLNWFTVRFNLSGDPVFLDAQKELFIFRIAQEAFNNILKHAQAKNIALHLYYNEDKMNITISDDGVGFLDPPSQVTILTAGLRNMKKRAELLSGNCAIESLPGKGTTIKIEIPLK